MSEQQQPKASITFSSFADWYWQRDSLCEAARHTVEMVLQKAGTSDIDEANRILSSRHELSLQDCQISDITPLQCFANLSSLTLGNNRISDITPLQSLTNLTYLNLEKNQISDITSLQFLTNLRRLALSDNQISDITPLQFLTNLSGLALSDNQISDITPLQSLMSLTSLCVNLTPQQKTLIETSHHSWRTLANSTEPIHRAKASTALKFVCEILGLEAPEITFCSSPHETPHEELPKFQKYTIAQDYKLVYQLKKQVRDALSPFMLIIELEWELGMPIEWEEQLGQQSSWNVNSVSNYYTTSWIVTLNYLVRTLALAEFCVHGLGIVLKPESQKLFEALEQLLAECGWIFAFKNVCYLCDRPIKLSLDSEYRLHAEGASAIEFADGYKIYSHHGVTLPEKYGAVHPNNWQAQWLLEENNAELRRILIQEIGYARICQELQATELDSWQEYTLLRIDADIDGFQGANLQEPIHLLKMTCPSTGFIHALRVPPDIISARDAIRWVNWDIEPEEFSLQT